MGDQVHYIPVGFDFERLIHPISKGELNADRVVLISHKENSDKDSTSRAAELAQKMTQRLSTSFELIDIEVEMKSVEISELYNYEELFPMAHESILNELERGNEVFINISSMPRTTAFAFATASNSVIAEYQDELGEIRKKVHTYYVAPEKYLVLDMIEALEGTKELFEEMDEDLRVHQHYTKIRNLLSRIDERGVTQGARKLDSQLYVEFPSSPGGNIEGFEETVLTFLKENSPVSSTSELAEQLAVHLDEEYDESFRSRVQYNVSNLEEKGYVDRLKVGNRLQTQLSTMGRLWVKTR